MSIPAEGDELTPFWQAVLERNRRIERETGARPSLDLTPEVEAEIRASLPCAVERDPVTGKPRERLAAVPRNELDAMRGELADIVRATTTPSHAIDAVELNNYLTEVLSFPSGGIAEIKQRLRALKRKVQGCRSRKSKQRKSKSNKR